MTKENERPVLPEHMDRWSRNARLYEKLKGMGVCVTPIPEDHDPTKIREMIVSVDLPSDVVAPVQRSEVGQIVRPLGGDRDNVVDFPTKV